MVHFYKAVFFDLDGTLCIAAPCPTTAFVQFVRSLDIPIDHATEQRVKRWSHRFWGQDKRIQQEMSQWGKDVFWLNYSQRLLKAANVIEGLPERARLVRDWFYNQYRPQQTLAPGCTEVLCRLKAAGFTLGLISNRSSSLSEVVTELGLSGIFDLLLAAGDIGCWKPNPAVFAHALTYFKGLRPEECLYVGDNYYADGLGAQRAGLIPIIFDPDNLYEQCIYYQIRHLKELLPFLGCTDDLT